MKRVLRRLGLIDEGDVVQAKGRVACEINSADELLLTELIYDGVFIDLTPQQCVALLGSIVFLEKVKLVGFIDNRVMMRYSPDLSWSSRSTS